MGQPQPVRQVLLRSGSADSAVTPVIGAILILAITILGIAGVLMWGAPLIERIQVQNAQTAVVGEFQDLRDSSRELSVPDHSRFPTIVIPRGQVSLVAGSRVMVTVDQDAGATSCDFRVTEWSDTTSTASKALLAVAAPGCKTPVLSAPTSAQSLFEVYQVSGSTVTRQTTITGTASAPSVTGADFSTGDWMFRLTNGAATPVVYAQSWLLSSDAVSWTTDSSSGKRAVTLDNGAIFSSSDGRDFLEKPAIIGDNTYGTSYYGLWLRSLSAASYTSITGDGSHQVYLSLVGNYDRMDSTGVYRLRYDFSGSLAESWCNALVQRTTSLTGASYVSQVSNCGSLTGANNVGVRSVCYTKQATASNLCGTPGSATGSSFAFRFLHARIYTALSL